MDTLAPKFDDKGEAAKLEHEKLVEKAYEKDTYVEKRPLDVREG